MKPSAEELATYCGGCVYYPPNLPETFYSAEDYQELQQKRCSYDHSPGDNNCLATQKTSCSIVDLQRPDNLIKPE